MNDHRLFACENCFKDKRLREFIREHDKKGNCPWCGSKNAYIISIDELGPLFRDVAYIYGEATYYAGGDFIDWLLQGDWEIFSEKIEGAPDDLMRQMTIEILKAGLSDKDYHTNYPDYSGLFQSKDTYCLEEEWENKLEELLKETSCHARKTPPFTESEDEMSSGVKVALEDLVTDYDKGQIFYRARIHEERSRTNRFTLTELGAPPPNMIVAKSDFRDEKLVLRLLEEKVIKNDRENPDYIYFNDTIANEDQLRERLKQMGFNEIEPILAIWRNSLNKAGRANRKGEPVLYLSSDAQTALSEKRAWKGAAVAIAKMRLCRQLLVVNLLDFKLPDSPFFEENLEWKLQLIELLRNFAEELSRPVMLHEQDQLYIPSQHLCDLIKNSRYDGVVYPSSMGAGYNVVLFNPKDAKPIDVNYFRVKEINFQVDILEEHDEIYEELPYYLIK